MWVKNKRRTQAKSLRRKLKGSWWLGVLKLGKKCAFGHSLFRDIFTLNLQLGGVVIAKKFLATSL